MDQQTLPSDWTRGEWNTGLAVDVPWQPAMIRQGPAGRADVLPVRSTGEVAGMGYVLPIDRIRIPT